jgi:hypothetical protein
MMRESAEKKRKRLWPVEGVCLAQILEWQRRGYFMEEVQAVADEAGVSPEIILRRLRKYNLMRGPLET